MPRRKPAPNADITPAAAEPTPSAAPAADAPAAEAGPAEPAAAPFADRHPLDTVALGPANDAPKMRLFRSDKYQQMQISFDEKPGEPHRARLQQAGWRWRAAERVWTKQFEAGARWRTQADAERLFAEIANAVRAGLGLPPVGGPAPGRAG